MTVTILTFLKWISLQSLPQHHRPTPVSTTPSVLPVHRVCVFSHFLLCVSLHVTPFVLSCSTHTGSQAELSIQVISFSCQWPYHGRHGPSYGWLVRRSGGESQSQRRGRCCKCVRMTVDCIVGQVYVPLRNHSLFSSNLHSVLIPADKWLL